MSWRSFSDVHYETVPDAGGGRVLRVAVAWESGRKEAIEEGRAADVTDSDRDGEMPSLFGACWLDGGSTGRNGGLLLR